MSEWQPISTAPRDGRRLLAAVDGEAAQRTERSPAERFAAAILLPCLRGDRSVMEGWEIEEAALAAGLIKEVQAQEPCGARCACSDLGVGFPTTCNRLTEAGKALLCEA
ncbi:MAG: hypothetical protein IRY87_36215 [Acetobacteraceae bacterium]|nr:hypothetical protein [Acetobacteraceae bacterium]